MFKRGNLDDVFSLIVFYGVNETGNVLKSNKYLNRRGFSWPMHYLRFQYKNLRHMSGKTNQHRTALFSYLDFMQILTVQINNNSAKKTLQALEEKSYIKILKSPFLASPPFPEKQRILELLMLGYPMPKMPQALA